MSDFRKHRSGSVLLEVDCAHSVQPKAVTDAFAQHFQSIYNNHCPVDVATPSKSSEFLSPEGVTHEDVCKAIKKPKAFKSVRHDAIPVSVIKACSVIPIHILRHIFKVNLLPYCIERSCYCIRV
jgi:hypothetical protein